jgi:hypothetical protein
MCSAAFSRIQHSYFVTLSTVYESLETRDGWSLLTVETKANEDSKSTNESGPSLVGSFGLSVPVQEIFVLPWLL